MERAMLALALLALALHLAAFTITLHNCATYLEDAMSIGFSSGATFTTPLFPSPGRLMYA